MNKILAAVLSVVPQPEPAPRVPGTPVPAPQSEGEAIVALLNRHGHDPFDRHDVSHCA